MCGIIRNVEDLCDVYMYTQLLEVKQYLSIDMCAIYILWWDIKEGRDSSKSCIHHIELLHIIITTHIDKDNLPHLKQYILILILMYRHETLCHVYSSWKNQVPL